MTRRDNRPAAAIALSFLIAAAAIGPSQAADRKAVAEAFEAANAKMHAGMAASLSGNADRDFVTGMILHHQGAIDMARIVLEHGQDPQIKALARDIVDAQSEEIAVLEAWLAGHPAAGESQTPYAGLERRRIKALSAEQIEDLRAGRGMGLALAAELNGYTGPAHVIELADDLSLTPEQVADLARLGGELRFVHLNTHLAVRGLLTPEQASIYADLRGYGAEVGAGHGHHGQHESP